MKHLLLVDDDPDLLRCLETFFVGVFDITTASDAREALRLAVAPKPKFDAVLVDLTMPYLDGAQFVRELRRQKSSVPVILTSAREDLPHRAHELGALGYVAKPYQLAALPGMIHDLLGDLSGIRHHTPKTTAHPANKVA